MRISQAIAVASAQRVFNDYPFLYPRPFDAQVDQAARLAQLAPDFIYAVLRQESLYRADAISSADARGLMQLQLDTARRTARHWKQPRPDLSDLFDSGVSTLLGAARLRTLLDQFDPAQLAEDHDPPAPRRSAIEEIGVHAARIGRDMREQVVFIGDNNGTEYGLSLQNGGQVFSGATSGTLTASAAVADGMLYFINEGTLYAYAAS